MKIYVHLWSHLAKFFLEREIVQKRVVEKIKTHIWFSIIFSENRAIFYVIWTNTVEPDRPQMTI
jgi:hypothetical protein